MSDWKNWEPETQRTYEHIIFQKRYRERGGGVARIQFNHPERMNSYDIPMGNEVIDALVNANRDNTIGVILLTHVGDHFGVGGNVQALSSDANSTDMMIGGISADTVIGRSLKPVVAVVRGYCIGMHNHLAYHCDLTIAGESAVFGQTGPKVGSPISGSLVAVSAQVLGMKRAKQLWMENPQLTAQEALSWGLVNAVVQDPLLDEKVEELCDELLDRVPTTIAGVKQSLEGVLTPLAATNSILTMIDPDFANRPEIVEASQAFYEKRKPNFWTDEMTTDRF